MNQCNVNQVAHCVGVPIKKLSARSLVTIDNAPQAQKRTAKFKKSVKIVGDLVFKGPYKFDDSALIRSLKYTYVLQFLENTLQLPDWQRGVLPWEYIGYCGDNQYYLVAQNVGKRKDIPFELVSSKIESDVLVVPRGGVVWRVSDEEKNGRLTKHIKLAAMQHLYFRFLLDIGDSGTHNILLREDHGATGRLIAGIDLEEMRTNKDKDSRLTHLFTNAFSKKKRSLYEPEVRNIQSISFSQIDQHSLGRMSNVGIDMAIVKENIELWERLR